MKRKWNFNYLVVLLVFISSLVFTGCDNNAETTELAISDSDGTEDTQNTDEVGETETSAQIYVYVCGEVNCPGVYTVAADTRVYEVIELAGGMTGNAQEDYLNLAEPVEDGQQIIVISKDEYESMKSSAGSDGIDADGTDTASDGLININTATAEELTALPGIGDVKAEAIVSYREANGSFTSIEDIMNVDGIKEGSFSKIRDLIKVN